MHQAILLSPLIGALICGLFWRLLGQITAVWIAAGFMLLSAVLSWLIFLGLGGGTQTVFLADWVRSGTLDMAWNFRVDGLSAPLLVCVTSLSALLVIYSISFMRWDATLVSSGPYRPRFCAFLAFQSFAMTLFIASEDLGQLLVGWGLLGVGTYLLTGFYAQKSGVAQTANAGFVTNRIADALLLLAVILCFAQTDSMRFNDIFDVLAENSGQSVEFLGMAWNTAELLSALFVLAACIRAGQVVFHTWLAGATDAPLPAVAMVTALTTFIAAGFLLLRMAPIMLLAENAMWLLTAIGAVSAIFAALVACAQSDVSRALVFVAASQMGFLLTVLGLGLFQFALLDLLAFSVSQALLWLSVGAAVKAASDARELKMLHGLRRNLPFSCTTMVIAALAAAGFGIPFSQIGITGFVAKDAAIAVSHAEGIVWALLLAASLISFAVWRLVFRIFWGAPATQDIAEPSLLMRTCIGLLAVAALLSSIGPGAAMLKAAADWTGAPDAQAAIQIAFDQAPRWSHMGLLAAASAGFFGALLAYVIAPSLASVLAKSLGPLHGFLKSAGYVDKIFAKAIIGPVKATGELIATKPESGILENVIKGADALPRLHRLAGRMQSGYLATYVFTLVMGLGVLITWVSVIGWAN
ncbi:MAG: proton-conducting transporter membrane subunit [Pseudomonadota bacterium]